ncbi:MAG: hypothetical protein KJ914_07905 [Gammaproteobacteria bacterium]|nr:hypothetical protein [Gammaproteobacteria bacterium]MBU1723695.1 hypothetical protein [Gammaproteobacteria bacterium]MBU2004779.1 hypothetical protein [Gammaproteobacteria bacterium]
MNTPQPNGYQTWLTDDPEFVQQPAARLPWFHICTVMDRLPIASMIPDDVERELRSLDELGRVILMLAHRLGEISNEDIQHYRREHPRDIGVRLKQLVTANWLEKAGHGRGTRYRLPVRVQVDGASPANSEHLSEDSEHLGKSSEHFETEQELALLQIAENVRNKRKVSKPLMEATILTLCAADWLSLKMLAHLLNRTPDSLRNHYITPMLSDGRLQARMPDKPNHPNQAYRKGI